VKDAGGVGFDGFGGDREAVSDLRASVALANQNGDLVLARSEGLPEDRKRFRQKNSLENQFSKENSKTNQETMEYGSRDTIRF
jgi:hypothetical protein